jgi:hypothetical protein
MLPEMGRGEVKHDKEKKGISMLAQAVPYHATQLTVGAIEYQGGISVGICLMALSVAYAGI